jgi:hypothetical protein
MADPLHPIPTVLPMCNDPNAATNTPCWNLAAPPAGQANQCQGQVVNIQNGGVMPPNNTKSDVNCSLCVTGFPDPTRNCP